MVKIDTQLLKTLKRNKLKSSNIIDSNVSTLYKKVFEYYKKQTKCH